MDHRPSVAQELEAPLQPTADANAEETILETKEKSDPEVVPESEQKPDTEPHEPVPEPEHAPEPTLDPASESEPNVEVHDTSDAVTPEGDSAADDPDDDANAHNDSTPPTSNRKQVISLCAMCGARVCWVPCMS